MKISALETIRLAEFGNLLWLRVHTSEGIVGLGETFMSPVAVEAYVHETLAPKVLGRDPLQIDLIAKEARGYLGFRSSGVEMRAASALDIALWDILGKVCGQPIAQLLGGFSRRKIRTYNTCAGSAYMRQDQGQSTANWGLSAGGRDYDDLNGFLNRADELAADLLSEGITAMKIWPFDIAAEANAGVDISNEELKAALLPFEKIRAAVGDKMEIMVEFHSLWHSCPRCGSLARSRRSTRNGTKIRLRWTASPASRAMPRRLRRLSALPKRWRRAGGFRDLLETGFSGIVMLDLSWCGGLSEARKIAAMAETWHLPVRASRLHGSRRPLRFHASVPECAERADPGKRAGLLPDLVPRSRHRAARSRKRVHHDAFGTRSRNGVGARHRQEVYGVNADQSPGLTPYT